MNRYTVRANASAAVLEGTVSANLWNPSSTRRIEVVEFGIFDYAALTSGISFTWLLSRSTSQGASPGSTVTPDADNAHQADSVPPSGCFLDLGSFGTQPTLATPPLTVLGYKVSQTTAKPDGGVRYFPGDVVTLGIMDQRPIVIPPGTGLALHMTGSTDSEALTELYIGFED